MVEAVQNELEGFLHSADGVVIRQHAAVVDR